jgi:hypothetical protein
LFKTNPSYTLHVASTLSTGRFSYNTQTNPSYTLHEAFFLARSKRAIITPNLGFMEQLCDFEEGLLGESSIDMFKYQEW